VIDWDAPDEPDCIKPQGVVEIRTLSDAMKLIDAWEAAYAELRREYHLLHHDYIDMKFWREVEHSNAAIYETLFRAAMDPANDDVRDTLSSILRQT